MVLLLAGPYYLILAMPQSLHPQEDRVRQTFLGPYKVRTTNRRNVRLCDSQISQRTGYAKVENWPAIHFHICPANSSSFISSIITRVVPQHFAPLYKILVKFPSPDTNF